MTGVGRRDAPRSSVGALFREQAKADFRRVGAIAPSGRALAGTLAASITAGEPGSRRILEVGAGTGAVTTALVDRLGPADTLVVVEQNPVFAACLGDLVRRDSACARCGGRVRVVHAHVETLDGDERFHAIVSSLPFNNFTADEVAGHLRRFRGMLEPGGSLAFFEYLWVRPLRAAISGRQERNRLRGVGRVIAETTRAAGATSRIVWWNLPPAVVHVARLPPTELDGRLAEASDLDHGAPNSGPAPLE